MMVILIILPIELPGIFDWVQLIYNAILRISIGGHPGHWVLRVIDLDTVLNTLSDLRFSSFNPGWIIHSVHPRKGRVMLAREHYNIYVCVATSIRRLRHHLFKSDTATVMPFMYLELSPVAKSWWD